MSDHFYPPSFIEIPKQTNTFAYEDIFNYNNFDMPQQTLQDDPMTDQEFLAYLSRLSSSEPTPSSSRMVEPMEKKVKRSVSSSRVGQCDHPKHILYRQERYTLLPKSDKNTSLLKSIPRRGRPPKGSKSIEFSTTVEPCYSNVELSVRPLPKRLEAVVGKSNIKVCLTCLKRSDLDEAYLLDKAYVGPQNIFKKVKK